LKKQKEKEKERRGEQKRDKGGNEVRKKKDKRWTSLRNAAGLRKKK